MTRRLLLLLLLRVALTVLVAAAAAARPSAPAGSGDGEPHDGGDAAAGGVSRSDFPDGFVFGASTSAYQVRAPHRHVFPLFVAVDRWEGAAAEDGRKPSIWDTFAHSGFYPGNGDIAADGYHKYKEDIKLMKEIGLDAYRLSISWPRLIPNGRGEVNPKGLDYYNSLIDELLDNGIQPHVTIFQYDLPQALEDEYNGWLSPQIIGDFIAYADVCFRKFGDRVTYWSTLNEPNAFALIGYDAGVGPPGRCSKPFGNCSYGNSATEPYIVAHHSLLAHSSAVSLYREKYQERQKGLIGMDIFITDFLPYTTSKEDIAAAERAQVFYTGWFLDPLYYGDYPIAMKRNVGSKLPKFSRGQSKQLMNSIDFLGVNYYTVTYVKYVPHDAPLNKRDFLADASAMTIGGINGSISQTYVPSSGLQRVLKYFKQSYGNPPIYIHENGFPMSQDVIFDDGPRVVFLSEHLRSLLNSVRNGSNTKGYFVWSLVDLYELLGGNKISYGLYHVDYTANDLKRYPRRSAIWYTDFLKARSKTVSTRSSDYLLLVSSV
ncbi:hypothetical protein ACP4OV_020522 [Aristida adscensionis]